MRQIDRVQIQKLVGLAKPGPMLGMLTNAAVDWQLANPQEVVSDDGTAPEGLVTCLQSKYKELAKL